MKQYERFYVTYEYATCEGYKNNIEFVTKVGEINGMKFKRLSVVDDERCCVL